VQACFECGRAAAALHHVVPESRGGTRTVPLCLGCHAKVHGAGDDWMELPALQRAGIERARARGAYGGRRGGNGEIDAYQADSLALMGYSHDEIAESLGVTPGTVRRYLNEGRPTTPA
jgi:hypothetical protein